MKRVSLMAALFLVTMGAGSPEMSRPISGPAPMFAVMEPLAAESMNGGIVIALCADNTVMNGKQGDLFTVTMPAAGGSVDESTGEDMSVPHPVQLKPILIFSIPLTQDYKSVRENKKISMNGNGYVLLTGADHAQVTALASTLMQTASASPVKAPLTSPFQEGQPVRTLAITANGDPVITTMLDFAVGIIWDTVNQTEICEITTGGQ
ncbi:MAG: hypothetical protein WCV86_02020 [Patescibacteria group bacterium]|jgi:hypothetical protein